MVEHRAGALRLAAWMLTVSLIAAACGGGDTETSNSSVLGATIATGGATTTAAPGSTTTVALANAITSTTTTTTAVTTTTLGATTSTGVETTTTQATTTTEAVPATVPATIVAATFDFAGGPGPKFSVAVEVGPGVDGPWESADLSPGPSLDTSSFFVRFTVQNLDTLGYMTQLQVDSDVLGVDLCPNHVSEADQLEPDVPAGNPDAVVVCTVGPFQTEPGDQAIAFSTPENAGYRQGDNDCGFFEVPILAPPASPGEHVFTFYFEPADLCGLGPAVSGHAPGSPVDLGLGLLTATDVDCSDQFNGSGGGYSDDPAGSPNLGNGDPRVVAYSVTTFDGGGAVTGQCSNIPQFDDPFDAIDGPDDVFHYVGLTQP